MAIPSSMEDRDGHIWFDNKMTPWREAKTHVLTHTLHYGMGVFEGVRAYKTNEGTAIFRLKEHTDRFFNSAHILGMKMPYDKNVIMDAHKKAVKENKLELYGMGTSTPEVSKPKSAATAVNNKKVEPKESFVAPSLIDELVSAPVVEEKIESPTTLSFDLNSSNN